MNENKRDMMIMMACKGWFSRAEKYNSKTIVGIIKNILAEYISSSLGMSDYITEDDLFRFVNPIIKKIKNLDRDTYIFKYIGMSKNIKLSNQYTYVLALISIISYAKTKDIPDWDEEMFKEIKKEYNLKDE